MRCQPHCTNGLEFFVSRKGKNTGNLAFLTKEDHYLIIVLIVLLDFEKFKNPTLPRREKNKLYKTVFVNFSAHDTQNFDLLSLNRFSHKLYIITMCTSRLVGDYY